MSSVALTRSLHLGSVQGLCPAISKNHRVNCSIKPRKANPPPTAAANRHLSPHYVEPRVVDGDVDRAYWTDDDVTPVLFDEEDASWQDSTYVNLTMRSYKIVREETQHALQNHFMQQQQKGQHSHHSVCAPTAGHTFLCGEDDQVASQVSPACIQGGNVFYGTSH
eukprot:TRINITY_DN79067_c0_g1_i1.p1 TRINITY_DN79067_c0_g1~~TRINITY_DN79067_c0_g1_i1.p1  ORF type:complete len:165 (+),score=3.90 TRINITY_DN79067_c0_g1_i1:223-717(+)